MGLLNGAGKYGEHAREVFAETRARLVIVLVIGGKDGDGFAVQGGLTEIVSTPERLRLMASSIEQQLNGRGTDRVVASRPFNPSNTSIDVREIAQRASVKGS
jgi:hypothetical protein